MKDTEPEIRILLVDDEKEFLEAVGPGMGRRGFEVSLAEDGYRALELLDRHVFDVVVLDVKMPGMDGVDVFREIRRKAPDVPVVMLTGHGNIQQAFQTSREGVFEYLTKPCDVDRLATVARMAAVEARRLRSPEGLPPVEIRLLLVDDDRDFVHALTPALERRGVTVTVAHGGEEAIEVASQQELDVALVDVVMPGMDGLTLLNRLKEADGRMEIVILTGNPAVGDVRRGLKEGAFDYLTKPQPVEQLVQVLKSAWDRRRQRVEEELRQVADRALEERPD